MTISQQAKEIVQEKIINQASINVVDLAKVLHTSPSNLYRQIKKETGLSTAKLIHHTRLEWGTILLIHTNLSVSQIAQKIGFNDSTYFIRSFKEKDTITPKQYRIKQRKS